MSVLRAITLTQFKNYSYQQFAFHQPFVGIVGPNGTGKTNLLDAIYYLCFTKSYFQAKEIQNCQFQMDGFRVDGLFCKVLNDEQKEGDSVVCVWKEGKKTVSRNGVAYKKVMEHIGQYSAVMIAPDDIALINEGSELRRKFIDGILAQSDVAYLENLIAYQRVLQQKNAFLKQEPTLNNAAHLLLDSYDEQLAHYGQQMIASRLAFTQLFPQQVGQYYQSLSQDREAVDIQYKRCVAEQENLLQKIKESRFKDCQYRRSTVGPHTEDWQFLLNEQPLKTYASQGQKKSFLIALKLAHIQFLQQLGKNPILLLDDIFEKLDTQRLSQLFIILRDMQLQQVIMTHTQENTIYETIGQEKTAIQIIHLS